MRCHHIMLDLMVLLTCLGQALTDHCDCDESSNGCENIHICYNCEYSDYMDEEEDCQDSLTGIDKETCRTMLTQGSRKQALYTQQTDTCILISRPDICYPRYSENVDVVFLKTCGTGCTNYTITKHENTAVVAAGNYHYTTEEEYSSGCQSKCFPVTQDCTVSFASGSETCTVFPNCGESCLTVTSSGVDVYTVTCNPVACSVLSDPPNGVVNMSAGLSPGAQAVYSCKAGYNLTGSSVVICNSDGQWSGSTPSCTPVDCGIPAEPEFSSAMYTETIYGANATYTCDTGYNISEPGSRSCLANGSWELPEPKCVPVDCGPIPNLENGTVDIPEGTTFGKTATFACDAGFVLLHGSIRVCQKDSQWSGIMPSCKAPEENAETNGLGRLFIMPCICYPNKTFEGLTEEEIIQQLIADTKIEPKDTKLAVSKLISKPDPRVSSKMIGSVAIVVLSIIGGLILCTDIMTIRARRRALKG